MGQVSLVIAFAIPLLFLVAVWLAKSGNMKLRVFVTLALPLFYWLHWHGLQNTLGWPSPQKIPDQFQLIAADVVEPHENNGGSGWIHLWVRQEEGQEPRAYRLEYSRSLHKILHETRKRTQNGIRQRGVIRADKGTGRGVSIGDGRRLEFEDMVRRQLPSKQ